MEILGLLEPLTIRLIKVHLTVKTQISLQLITIIHLALKDRAKLMELIMNQ